MKIGKHNWLIGCDPEVFIRSLVTGELVSACGMLPGTKEQPFKVPHGAVQVDGMAAEFNIDPAKNANEFVRNCKSVMKTLDEMIGEDYELAILPTANFGKELIDAQPDEAKILGCDPDYDAWDEGKQNDAPNVDTPYRTAAGHIHIGWTENVNALSGQHRKICEHLIRNLDHYTSFMMKLEGGDTKRRQLYGMAGSYRPKSYGCEYRTPSNVWLTSEKTMRLMFRAVKRAIEACVFHPWELKVVHQYDAYTYRSMFQNGWNGMSYDARNLCKMAYKCAVEGDAYV
jgi:hypothetical protein